LISQKRVVFARGRQPESNEKEKGRPSNLCAAVPAGPRRPEGNDPKKGRSSSSPSNLPVGRAGSVRIVRGIRRDKERKIIGTAFERFRFALRFFFLAFFRSFVAQKAMLEGKANSRSRSIATPLHLHLRLPLLLDVCPFSSPFARAIGGWDDRFDLRLFVRLSFRSLLFTYCTSYMIG